MSVWDVAIVGAGMAGAGLAAALAGKARVLLLEAEDRAGYHSTGRSAAFWSETYGGPLIQPLTSASRPALAPFLSPRGCLHIADAAESRRLRRWRRSSPMARCRCGNWTGPSSRRGFPGCGRAGTTASPSRPARTSTSQLCTPNASGRAARALVAKARLLGAERRNGIWRIATTGGGFEAAILVNAAGAWADAVALAAGEQPLGIRPFRRTIVQLRVDPPVPADLPLVVDAAGRFYFKPGAGGRLWLSPHDETSTEPCDCAPEELDVAVAIDRLEQAVDWRVAAVEHKWAGLRSFAPDRLPVYGFSPSGRGFFWCAGQGGFGIQTAPAASALAARLLLGDPAGDIDPVPYSARRFA